MKAVPGVFASVQSLRGSEPAGGQVIPLVFQHVAEQLRHIFHIVIPPVCNGTAGLSFFSKFNPFFTFIIAEYIRAVAPDGIE